MARLPFVIPVDADGRPVLKFLDAFELVRYTDSGEYAGYLHPDSKFVIVKNTNTDGDHHLTFHKGTQGAVLATAWAEKESLDYFEYDAEY